ncbi:MAG: hypothetical protein GX610_13540 [Rhodococcus sp.]|nr:hypothetical protein [Rhodococcus sp. (in: high G+C Gram-positive bacteria)]
MSDAELRKAIRTLRDRADYAKKHGDTTTVTTIEDSIKGYQDEMAHRL